MYKHTWEQAVQWLRDQPDSEELVKACYFDDPLLEAAKRYSSSDEWAAVRDCLPERGCALDIGAGRGISSYALVREGWAVTAVEPDPSPLVGAGAIASLAGEAGITIRIYGENAENLPFEDNTFDLIYGRQVLHHSTDLGQLCRDAYRVLKPGGMFIATREHVISRESDLEKFQKSHPLHALYGGEYAYKLKEYVAAIRGSKLTIKHIYGPFDSPINTFPRSSADCINEILLRAFGVTMRRLLASSVMRMACLQRIVLKVGSTFNNVPGRLYSFIAIKPT